MRYEFTKKYGSLVREVLPLLPWRTRILTKFMPKNVSKVKDFKKWAQPFEELAKTLPTAKMPEGKDHEIIE